MYLSLTKALLVLLLDRYAKCQRRIVNGQEMNKSYVVYVVWELSGDNPTEFHDTTTICGGFLVRENFAITSAVCLKMFPIQYVIAGYNKYIPGAVARNKEEEECLAIAKKPIIEKCYFYNKKTELKHGWQNNDICIGRLDTAYDLNDRAFTEKCSYQPTVANFEFRTLEPGTDVVVYGWGSNRYHKPENVSFDLNQNYLMATTTRVITLEECDRYYNHSIANKSKVRFCTEGESSLDVYGEPTDTRRANTNNTQSKPTYALDVLDVPGNKTIALSKNLIWVNRRHGPCQNDHGGPIATWKNGKEVVVGIVTGYLVDREMKCVGPYLYLSLINFRSNILCTLKKFHKT